MIEMTFHTVPHWVPEADTYQSRELNTLNGIFLKTIALKLPRQRKRLPMEACLYNETCTIELFYITEDVWIFTGGGFYGECQRTEERTLQGSRVNLTGQAISSNTFSSSLHLIIDKTALVSMASRFQVITPHDVWAKTTPSDLLPISPLLLEEKPGRRHFFYVSFF